MKFEETDQHWRNANWKITSIVRFLIRNNRKMIFLWIFEIKKSWKKENTQQTWKEHAVFQALDCWSDCTARPNTLLLWHDLCSVQTNCGCTVIALASTRERTDALLQHAELSTAEKQAVCVVLDSLGETAQQSSCDVITPLFSVALSHTMYRAFKKRVAVLRNVHSKSTNCSIVRDRFNGWFWRSHAVVVNSWRISKRRENSAEFWLLAVSFWSLWEAG